MSILSHVSITKNYGFFLKFLECAFDTSHDDIIMQDESHK